MENEEEKAGSNQVERVLIAVYLLLSPSSLVFRYIAVLWPSTWTEWFLI